MIRAARPLFLIGIPRSGTTVLTRLLNAHKQILLTNETAVFIQLNELINKSRVGIRAGIMYGKDYHELWADTLRAGTKELIETFYGSIAVLEDRQELAYWGDKHPHFHLCLPFLEWLYPKALYIYAVRDPRDAACSLAAMSKVSIAEALDNWHMFANVYEPFVAKLPADRCVVSKYENLVKGYDSAIDQILAKVGLQQDASLRKYVSRLSRDDAHATPGSRSQDFSTSSLARWKKEMTSQDAILAVKKAGAFMEKYGYPVTGENAMHVLGGNSPQEKSTAGTEPARTPEPVEKPKQVVRFTCNVCGASNSVQCSALTREKSSCRKCGSSVRLRSIVHLLSLELFGESLVIKDFPVRKDLAGVGLSDWKGYASKLNKYLDYTNTFYHKKPYLDITNLEGAPYHELDFIIATDVFEHLAPPVSRGFQSAKKLLKPGGRFIMSVPYTLKGKDTTEHYPDLHDYELVESGNEVILRNVKKDGVVEVFNNLKFHGGVGSALEMRIFTRTSLLREFKDAGFSSIDFCNEPYLKYGIEWSVDWSLPCVAK